MTEMNAPHELILKQKRERRLLFWIGIVTGGFFCLVFGMLALFFFTLGGLGGLLGRNVYDGVKKIETMDSQPSERKTKTKSEEP